MNKRQCAGLLRKLTTGRGSRARLDVQKVPRLTPTECTQLVEHLVRCRGPIVKEVLDRASVDHDWLAACGYLYTTQGRRSGYTFVHTCEHQIR